MSVGFRWAIAGMGKVAAGGHHHGILRNRHELVGFTTTDPSIRMGDATHVAFNWGTSGLKFDSSKMIVAERPDDDWLRALRGKADGVIVCVPTPNHREVVERVLQAGFDCLVEKPLAVTSAEGRELIALSTRLQRKLLVAHVLPAFKEFSLLRTRILEEGLAKLHTLILNRWVPQSLVDKRDPKAVEEGFFLDLGVHDAHFVSSLGRVPIIKRIAGAAFAHDRLQWANVEIELDGFPNATIVIDAGASLDVEEFRHGFDARWVDGSALCLKNTILTNARSTLVLPEQSVGDIFGDELKIAAACIAKNGSSAYLSPIAALEALKLIEQVRASSMIAFP